MKFDVLTLFPEMFEPVKQSVIGRAAQKNLLEINLINIRDFSKDKHKKVDDTIYGGGAGMLIKPDVVLYEEPLDDEVVSNAIKAISECDLLIIAGTSLVVYPAASYIRYFKGRNLVIINKDSTSYDGKADLVIHDKLGNIFSRLK